MDVFTKKMADNYDDELELLEINNSTVNVYDYSILNPSDCSATKKLKRTTLVTSNSYVLTSPF